ncbi:hypothetical protein [Nocardia fluminea]|uniref:hypothetical protein n=1 Tax=Nocardia fluminea TaxID=134984 RepID=UPI0034074E13
MHLEVGPKALRKRRDELKCAAEQIESGKSDLPSVCLLMFYAAECGLKERYITRSAHRDTGAVPKTHNLRDLAKEFGLPPTLSLEALQKCRYASGPDIIALAKLHEAWRYGVTVREGDQQAALGVLRALIRWCEQDGR